ncbi:hypothetical protein B0H19DRAFT_1228302 [Mycena capillaripes]|nr:hypothetical protein B0H19DRAFT_1228302 [Mycena capillaripes]
MPAQAEWGLEAYTEGRLPGVHLRDTVAIEKYHSQLEVARRRAERNPIAWGQSMAVVFVSPHHPPAESPPQFTESPFRPTFAQNLSPTQQTPADRRREDVAGLDRRGGKTGTTLVLKIIQPSMCPYPKADRCWSGYMKPADLAHREAWGYERLAHKQGHLVPYFFGLDTITTPSGERAWVLVLEYIPGITFAALLESPSKSFSDTCDLMKLSINVATEFASDGWLHMDLNPRNILVTGIPRVRGIVFIDLTFTCRLPSSEMDLAATRQYLYSDIIDQLDFDPHFQQWAKANIPDILSAPDDETSNDYEIYN